MNQTRPPLPSSPAPEPTAWAATPAIGSAHAAYAGGDWTTAFDLFTEVDRTGGLGPVELERLADTARVLARNDHVIDALERAHRAYAAAGDLRAAARTALALCKGNDDLRNDAMAASWWARADALIADLPEGPEHGLHAWFVAQAKSNAGDLAGHEAAAERAYEIARRFGDRNVEALALIEKGHIATARGRTAEAHAAIERATSLAIGGELGVLESGMVFCNAIWAYRSRGEWSRASEWTDSASRWADRMRVRHFPGLCRIHRSEVLRVRGELVAAECESSEAARMLETDIPRYAMVAHAELGEVRRRRGDLAGALEAFQNALELGWDPQPGLALLLLEQGDPVAAHRALERMFVEPVSTYICEDRSGLLAARTTVALAAGEPAIAEQAAGELEGLAAHNDTLWDAAAAAQARGEVEHARGRVSEAARHYTRAHAAWAELEVPFELARTRAALGRALAADGDRRGAQLEMGAAERIFARIGATRERDRVAACLAELTAASGTKGGPAAASSSPGAGSGAGAGAGSGAGAGAGSGAGAGAGADAQAREARLACEGDYWSLSWGGNVVRLRDGRGPRYLAALLARPGVDQWSIELARDTAADPGEARSVRMAAAGDVEAERTTAAGLGDAGEFLDDEARAAYRCRLEDLRHDLDQARDRDDADAAETILCEMHQLGSSLAAAVGLGGRSRRAGSAAERARQSVSKALRATVRKVAATDSWLGHYLKATVSTGTACRFDPDPRHPVHWLVEVS